MNSRSGRRLRWAVTAVGVAGAGAGAGILALSAVTHLVAGPRTTTVARVPRRPVAIVLGAQVFPGSRPSGFLTGRLEVALELWRAGKVEAVLVSGANDPEHHGESDAMKAWLVDHGVPDDAVVCDPAGHDTFATMARAVGVYQLTEAIVVSQLYHLPRALTTARALGLDAWGVGDVSARQWLKRWRYGELREIAAGVKMVAELIIRERPDAVDLAVIDAVTDRR